MGMVSVTSRLYQIADLFGFNVIRDGAALRIWDKASHQLDLGFGLKIKVPFESKGIITQTKVAMVVFLTEEVATMVEATDKEILFAVCSCDDSNLTTIKKLKTRVKATFKLSGGKWVKM